MRATKTKIEVWRRLGAVALALCLFLLAGTAARGQSSSPDVGMITRLSGEATYWNSGDQAKPARVRAFMKVRQGDKLKLAAGTALQILYLAPGRQETWQGPVTLTVGEGESQVAPGLKAAPPEVKLLPTRVSRKIRASETPLSRESMRHSGVITTMGVKTVPPGGSPKPTVASDQEIRQELLEAHRTYATLRQQTPADDLTPELYYLSVLAEKAQYAEMEKFIDGLLAKDPENANLKELRGWAQRQLLKGAQP